MGTSRHPTLPPASLLLILILFQEWRPSLGQMGLTLPLTSSSKNKSSLGLFAKWTGGGQSHPSMNAPSMENELAAIFRGVAYGVTTEPTTSTTTTPTTTSTTTTTTPRTTIRYHSENETPFSFNNGKESSSNQGARPVQHLFVESPVIEAETDEYGDESPFDSSTEGSPPAVVRADVGVSDIPWIAALGTSWQIHVYMSAGLFSLIALLSLYCLSRMYLSSQLLPRGYYITVHLLVFLASFFRCVIFFHDPYAARQRLPNGLSNILFNTGSPCVITALAVLVLALLRAGRLKILPLNLQSPIAVAVISGGLVVGSVVVDIIGGMISEDQLASGLRAGIQALIAGWGSALCVGYIVIFSKILSAAKRQQTEMIRLSFSRLHIDGASMSQRFPKCSLSHGAKATVIASISGLLLAILQVYGLMNTDGIINIPPRQPWVWFGYQTSCRFLEILMWTCVCIASALPANLSNSKRNQSNTDDGHLLSVFSCNGCCSSCSNISSCCLQQKKSPDDLYSTICQSNHVARTFPSQMDCKPHPQDTIASTAMHPKRVSTTLLPPKARKTSRKTATLRSGNSDVQLLWNNNSSSNSSSRPSSLILTEGGLIKFRSHDPHAETIKIANSSKLGHENKSDILETQNKILHNCNGSGEDNYINSGALTPEEKRFLENSIKSGNYPMLIESNAPSGNYKSALSKHNSMANEGNVRRNFGSNVSFEPNKFLPKNTSMRTANSFDLQLYEDSDQAYYQSPSLDSSLDSNGHVYASIQQPTFRSQSFGHQPLHEKILNNSSFHSPISQRTPATSPQLDVMQTDYLTDDASQEYISPQFDKSTSFPESFHYPIDNDRIYRYTNSRPSPVHVYKCYVPKVMNGNQGNAQSNIVVSDYMIHDGNKQFCDDKVSQEDEGCPASLQGRGFLNKIVSSNFGNVSYAPLQSEDHSFPTMGEEFFPPQGSNSHVRPCGHRPRHGSSNPKVCANSPPTSHRQTDNPLINNAGDREGRRDNEGLDQFSPHKDKSRQRQGVRGPQESHPQIDFEALQSHAFNSDRVPPWTDLKMTSESLSSTQPPSLDGSNFDLHSECVDTDEEGQGKKPHGDVRWPSKDKDDKGV